MAADKMFIPYNIFRHVCRLCVGYGADISCKQGKTQDFVLEISSYATASKVFSPARCGGDNVLVKRRFAKVQKNGRNLLQSQGRAAVVVGTMTPVTLEYSSKVEKVTVTFYEQRYDKDGFAQDLQLQALCNSV